MWDPFGAFLLLLFLFLKKYDLWNFCIRHLNFQLLEEPDLMFICYWMMSSRYQNTMPNADVCPKTKRLVLMELNCFPVVNFLFEVVSSFKVASSCTLSLTLFYLLGSESQEDQLSCCISSWYACWRCIATIASDCQKSFKNCLSGYFYYHVSPSWLYAYAFWNKKFSLWLN